MNTLIWFRADLRTTDNTALHHACTDANSNSGAVIAVFNIAPDQWLDHDDAPIKVYFRLRTLRALQQQLTALNIPLKIITTTTWQALPQALIALARKHNCSAIHANAEYEWNERQRDADVAELASNNNIAFQLHTDQTLYTPGSIRTGEDRPYTVYSPFKRNIYKRFLDGDRPASRPTPAPQQPTNIPHDPIPDSVEHFDTAADQPDRYPAGEHIAQQALSAFISNGITTYKDTRDFPALNSTSKLSHHLAAGSLSPRQCLFAALDANQGSIDKHSKHIVHWISEVLWREFYKHILISHPRVSRHQPFKLATNAIQWSDNQDHFIAWTQGRTGVPFVDAAMRQLNATGTMHNRLRMVTAMFLTKQLFIDWRNGERYFMQHLIDGDLAQNNGGWQWSASTGTDAAPYFRIFNPTSQSKKFDPDANYIRHWIPELASLDNNTIHEPHANPLYAPGNYPAPIINHTQAREHAINAFKALSNPTP